MPGKVYGHLYLPRLFITLTAIRFVYLDRAHAAAACFALFLVSSLLVRSFVDPWLGIGWAALGIGAVLSPTKWHLSPILAALVFLLVLHALAIPGSLFWGSGNWELTAGVVIWMAPALLLYLAGSRQVFAWLTPVFLIHAFLVIYQGFTNWHVSRNMVGNELHETLVREGSAQGLANNPNIAAGFLSIGIIYVMTGRHKWLAPPLVMALLFTGSRWALVVTAAVVLALLLTRTISWKAVVGALAGVVLAVGLIGALTPFGYTVAGYDSAGGAFRAAERHVNGRLAIPHIPSFLPSGVAEHPGLHNVPLRIAVESGVAAAILWVGVTGWALFMGWRGKVVTAVVGKMNGVNPTSERPPRTPLWPSQWHRGGLRTLQPAWWLLLTLVLLSMLDYYAWMGHLGGFWWLLVGLLAKTNVTVPGIWSHTTTRHHAGPETDIPVGSGLSIRPMNAVPRGLLGKPSLRPRELNRREQSLRMAVTRMQRHDLKFHRIEGLGNG